MSDSEIVDLINSDDNRKVDRAFHYLYKKNYSAVKNFVRMNSGSEDSSAEIFQEALVIFFVKVQKGIFRLESSIGAYLFSVCRNLWLKELQRRRLSVLTTLNTEQDYAEEESILISQKKMRKVLQWLDEGCRQVLIDFYFLKISVAELASKYGLGSEGAAKNKKYRCLKRLIELINKRNLELSDFLGNE